MCGIAGFYDTSLDPAAAESRLRHMLKRLAHRGPDDEGLWLSGPVAIGHRRLSIIDLSPAGHQPMKSADGRWLLAFNGEIYNHGELRDALIADGVGFRGHSDTEVLLALIGRIGFADALRRCVGMFAIALWDAVDRVLHLARDRFGEKPLYFGWAGGCFQFGSELKALNALGETRHAVDASAIESVLRYGFIPPSRSMYGAIKQVAPGTLVSFSESQLAARSSDSELQVIRFWDPSLCVQRGQSQPFVGDFREATDALEKHLRTAVALQVQADVPVGALLSGGVDSSVTTALMCAEATQRVRSYSIGFRHVEFNEAEHAKAVALHLGTDHTEWYVDESEAMHLVPALCDIYDEPLADSSQIPTLILARLVRRDVTVALSGDGADEVFGGYPKYNRGLRLWQTRGRQLIKVMSRVAHDQLASPLQRLLPTALSSSVPWHRLDTASAVMGATTMNEMAERVGTLNHRTLEFLSPRLQAQLSQSGAPRPLSSMLSFRRAAMLADVQSYLPGDILTKVDRATMAASLETRAPFLDHRIFEFAATLPESYLFDADGGKSVVRALLHRLVPRELVDRPKSGFKAPLGIWLRRGLRSWAYDLLATSAVAELLDVQRCRRLLDLHCQSHHDLSARIWPMLSVAAWAHRRSQAR